MLQCIRCLILKLLDFYGIRTRCRATRIANGIINFNFLNTQFKSMVKILLINLQNQPCGIAIEEFCPSQTSPNLQWTNIMRSIPKCTKENAPWKFALQYFFEVVDTWIHVSNCCCNSLHYSPYIVWTKLFLPPTLIKSYIQFSSNT